MRILILLMLVTLSSCSWVGRQTDSFMNWSNCNMPSSSGERKGCANEAAEQAKTSAREPAGNVAAPQGLHTGPSAAGTWPMPTPPSPPPNMGMPMPHDFGTTPQTNAKSDKTEDDFPAEYRNVKPGIDPTYDMMIPPPPI